jgi:hypothetical protein
MVKVNMTGKQMCEKIVEADILRKSDGTAPTAEEIWNSSSTGELYQVFMWFEQAQIVLDFKTEINRIAAEGLKS